MQPYQEQKQSIQYKEKKNSQNQLSSIIQQNQKNNELQATNFSFSESDKLYSNQSQEHKQLIQQHLNLQIQRGNQNQKTRAQKNKFFVQASNQNISQYNQFFKEIKSIQKDQIVTKLFQYGITYENSFQQTQITKKRDCVFLQNFNTSLNSQIISFTVQLGFFKVPITILNFRDQKKKSQHQSSIPSHNCINLLGIGAYSNVYGYFQNQDSCKNYIQNKNLSCQDHKSQQIKRKFAIKCVQYKSYLPMIAKEFNKKQYACQLAIYCTIQQYCYYKIFSALGIGAKISSEKSFDLILYDNCIQFEIEACQKIDNLKISIQQKIKKFKKDISENMKIMHDLRIIHLDIKNGNIMYSKEQNRYIFIDFGVTRQIQQKFGYKTNTSFTGTICYVSSQMKQIASNKKKAYVDLYYNDLHGVKTSIKFYEQKYLLIQHQNKVLKNTFFQISKVYSLYKIKYAIYFKKLQTLSDRQIRIGLIHFKKQIEIFLQTTWLDELNKQKTFKLFQITLQQEKSQEKNQKKNNQSKKIKYKESLNIRLNIINEKNKQNFEKKSQIVIKVFNKYFPKQSQEIISQNLLIKQIQQLLQVTFSQQNLQRQKNKNASSIINQLAIICNYFLTFLIQNSQQTSDFSKQQMFKKFRKYAINAFNQAYIKDKRLKDYQPQKFYKSEFKQKDIWFQQAKTKDVLNCFLSSFQLSQNAVNLIKTYIQSISIATLIVWNLPKVQKEYYSLLIDLLQKIRFLRIFAINQSNHCSLVHLYQILDYNMKRKKVLQFVQNILMILCYKLFNKNYHYIDILQQRIHLFKSQLQKKVQSQKHEQKNFKFQIKLMKIGEVLIEFYSRFFKQQKQNQQKSNFRSNFFQENVQELQEIYQKYNQNFSPILKYLFYLILAKSALDKNYLRRFNYFLQKFQQSYKNSSEMSQSYLLKQINFNYCKLKRVRQENKNIQLQNLYTLYKQETQYYLCKQLLSAFFHKMYFIEKIIIQNEKHQALSTIKNFIKLHYHLLIKQQSQNQQPNQTQYIRKIINIIFCYCQIINYTINDKLQNNYYGLRFQYQNLYVSMIQPILGQVKKLLFEQTQFFKKNQKQRMLYKNILQLMFGSKSNNNYLIILLPSQQIIIFLNLLQNTLQQFKSIQKQQKKQELKNNNLQIQNEKQSVEQSDQKLQQQSIRVNINFEFLGCSIQNMDKFITKRQTLQEILKLNQKLIQKLKHLIQKYNQLFQDSLKLHQYKLQYCYIIHNFQFLLCQVWRSFLNSKIYPIFKTEKKILNRKQNKNLSIINDFKVTQILFKIQENDLQVGKFLTKKQRYITTFLDYLLVNKSHQYFNNILFLIILYFKSYSSKTVYETLKHIICRSVKIIKQYILTRFNEIKDNQKKCIEVLRCIFDQHRIFIQKQKYKYLCVQLFPLKIAILSILWKFSIQNNRVFDSQRQKIGRILLIFLKQIKNLSNYGYQLMRSQYYWLMKMLQKEKSRKYIYFWKKSTGYRICFQCSNKNEKKRYKKQVKKSIDEIIIRLQSKYQANLSKNDFFRQATKQNFDKHRNSIRDDKLKSVLIQKIKSYYLLQERQQTLII